MAPAEPARKLAAAARAGFFERTLEQRRSGAAAALRQELLRQQNQIELIASENIVSPAVLAAQGSVLTNKYAEGYPGRRYYGGCEYVDVAETLALERARALFGCGFANVQPHSGASANLAAFMALLEPGRHGARHGARGRRPPHPRRAAQLLGQVVQGDAATACAASDHRIDFDQLRDLARQHRPRLIIAGGSAYPPIIDFAAFRQIADEVGAWLMVDMAHFAGLVAAGVHPSPFPHAHIVTSTTHKTLRGPRGGLILTDDEAIAKKVNSAVFPGLQGGPLMHVIAAKAVAFGEALQPDFKRYAAQVVDNAKALAGAMAEAGLDLVAGGTETHLMLVDLRPMGLTGKAAEASLERAGITCNKNGIPFDPEKPSITSGIRLGSPAATTRGFGIAEFQETGRLIAEVLRGLVAHGEANEAAERAVKAQVEALCARFPIYPAK